MKTTIADRDWKVLLDSLERGNCVVLLGPDLFLEGADGRRRNLATELSRRLAEILKSEERVETEDSDNFPLVAQMFLNRKTRAELEVEVTSFYDDVGKELAGGALHAVTFENLAALPFHFFVSLRHDPTLQNILEASGRKPIEKSYRVKSKQERTVGELGTIDRPLIYQLLGSTANPESLALTENDLLDLLEKIATGNPALPTDIRNQFQAKSFLFLGCGLRKYYLRVLLHILGLSRSRLRSYAVETIAVPECHEDLSRTSRESVWLYEVGYPTLKFLDSEVTRFLQDLRRRWDEKHPDASFRPTVTAERSESGERPKAFVSYMVEDRPFAEQLASKLDSKGIEPWLDTRNLRGGDKWDVALQDAIGKEVDFFIVLLSKHFGDGVETFVHLEIKEAEKRMAMRGDVKFIYPIQIDNEGRLPKTLDRERIHVWRLEDLDEDLASLAKDIKRQFAMLRRR